MSSKTQTANVTIRYLIGGALTALLAIAFVPVPHYIFAFSVVALYAVITALIHSEPASWQVQATAAPKGTRRNAPHTGLRFPFHREGWSTGSK